MADAMSGVSSSSSSEASVCDTALQYISDVHLITCRDHTSSDCVSDKQDISSSGQMMELREIVEMERIRGEFVPLIFDRTEFLAKGGFSLKSFIEQMRPFPVESPIVARLFKDLGTALLFLHCRNLAHGFLSADSVLVDKSFHGYLLIEHLPKDGRPTRDKRFPKAEDMFHFGELLHLLLSGEYAKFGEENNLLPLSPSRLPRDLLGLNLATSLLSAFPQFRPTAGAIVYHDWMQQFPTECRPRLIL